MFHVKHFEPMSAEQFQRATNVSRETLALVQAYCDLIDHWQGRVNLIARSTRTDIWRRHFLDSAQLAPHIHRQDSPTVDNIVVDIGSGAGFPGIILAILGVKPLHLVEANRRKAVFLEEAARQLGLDFTVHSVRAQAAVDALGGQAATVVARAVARLPQLLGLAAPLLSEGGTAILPRGRRWQEDIGAAQSQWAFEFEALESVTDPQARILRISKLAPKSRRSS
ncbi:MAG: 16S rRNA (guanine(527)-N(7))-methyltransferase RsmG [Alphaproteobacteria bacterium]|nr:16S rRNA (guanine(527)-N(7))-methyltransferase RsmG [Alphaproteobacteria bacterium]